MGSCIDKIHKADQSNFMDKTAVFGPALDVFPEEVWEAILERVKCSEDVKSVFLAFPELDKLFHKKKIELLFGLVLPHLMTMHLSIRMLRDMGVVRKWAQSKELLNLRLVSKRWKNTVDSLLQNEANQCPPPPLPADQTSGSVVSLPNENHFNYLPMSDYHLGTTIFENAQQVEKFMKDMENHKGNPFPGKSVWIRPPDALVRNSETLIAKCFGLFEKFGEHVTTLEINFYDRESRCHLKLCQNILKCLSKLPNLRSLICKGQFDGQRGDDFYEDRTDLKTSKVFGETGSQKLYPKLPKLESFVWHVLLTNSMTESNWTVGTIKAYGQGDQLRKLEIEENLMWDTVKTSSLTNLTELNLLLRNCFEPNLVKIEKVLRCLPFQGKMLRKFGLKMVSPWKTEVKINLKGLISILAGFQIENLVLEDLILEEGNDLRLEDDLEIGICAAETITSLVVEDNLALSYDFLKYLPNLRFLTVHQSNDVRCESNVEFEEGQETFAIKLRKAILRPSGNVAELWKRLPKLELFRGSVQIFLNFCGMHANAKGFNLGVLYVRECGNESFIGEIVDLETLI